MCDVYCTTQHVLQNMCMIKGTYIEEWRFKTNNIMWKYL